MERSAFRTQDAVGRSLSACLITATSAVLLMGGAVSEGSAMIPQSTPEAGQRVVLVTGSTSGLGREVARTLSGQGDHVIIHGRSVERGEALVSEIMAAGGSARFYPADFASLPQVREFAEAILRDYPRLDVLVNNAGIWLQPQDGRMTNPAGVEMHFQVNYLAGYLLTEILLPRLRESAPARIVNVASAAQRPIDWDDVMMESGYSDGRGYAQSKLAQIIHAFELADRLEGADITVTALHPATMMDTNMVLSRGAATRSSVDEGRDAVLQLVNSEDLGTGLYFTGMRETRANDQAYDLAARGRLMELSRRLVGG
jgi:NAD(P)-dependent dehydrogenase (short-subunit alcohol dehydrogenase family)